MTLTQTRTQTETDTQTHRHTDTQTHRHRQLKRVAHGGVDLRLLPKAKGRLRHVFGQQLQLFHLRFACFLLPTPVIRRIRRFGWLRWGGHRHCCRRRATKHAHRHALQVGVHDAAASKGRADAADDLGKLLAHVLFR